MPRKRRKHMAFFRFVDNELECAVPVVDDRRVSLVGAAITGFKHALPRACDDGIEFSAARFIAAAPDSGIQMFCQAYLTEIQSLKDIGILMHLAYPVLVLVLPVFTYLEFDDRMNGRISNDMAGVSQKP